MKLFDMKQQREAALAKADHLVTAAETAGRPLSDNENTDVDAAMAEVHALNPQIDRVEKLNTLRSQFPTGRVIAEPTNATQPGRRGAFSSEYAADFAAYCASRGTNVGAALAAHRDEMGGFAFPGTRANAASYEGSNAAGGYAVPSQVEGVFVPLAPPEFGVQKLATVVPTTMDTRYPRKAAHGTAAAKAESGGASNSFGGTDAAIEQFTLSAYMVGHAEDASWELLQDVNQFQGFMSDDVLLSIAILKESWFVSGSGAGQAQGLIGNTGTGVTAAVADAKGNLLSIDATFDVMGTLNAVYHPRASWLMNRASSIELRKAQAQTNLFEPVFNRTNGQDYLHGYPVEYSTAMPSIAATATPVLFGDFKSGYIIGERGGAGVNVKILDQPKALQGLLTILGYQRVDGRIRRSEAIQAITLHA
jgi:HK97 family phage major capsid protein